LKIILYEAYGILIELNDLPTHYIILLVLIFNESLKTSSMEASAKAKM
jgi:hypothetical protein